MAFFKTELYLFFIGLFSLYMVLSGRMSIRDKLNKKTQFVLNFLMSIVGFAFLIFAFHEFSSSMILGVILMIFAVIAFLLVFLDFRELKKSKHSREQAIPIHLTKMMSAFIASVTAFFVVNNRLLPPLVAWLSPTLIGTLLIVYWRRKYSIKQGKGEVIRKKESF